MTTRRPLADYSDEDLVLLDRMATRYSEAVTRHSELTTRLHVASANGDFETFAAVQKALPEAEELCRRYRAAVEVLRSMREIAL